MDAPKQPAIPDKPWQKDVADLAQLLQSNPQTGLTSTEADQRLRTYGPNQLHEKKGPGPWRLLFSQFDDFIVWVLIGAAVVSGVLGEWIDCLAIVGIVILNAILGFIQEYRAEKALAALRKLSSPNSKAWRDGTQRVLPSAQLVPGDVVELEAGDSIPADARVVHHTANFAAQEASLTGESTPVVKNVKTLAAEELGLGDRTNMLFMGTPIVSGRGRAMISATGMQTELGKIAGMIDSVQEEQTPLQRKLEDFGKLLVKICFILILMVFAMQMVRGGKLLDVFLTSVSLAVAAIPEGLPAVVTIALALGVQRMVRRHVLIRKLPSVESLGCATVICSDKTGTLTRNEMTVQAVYAGGTLYRVTGVGYEPQGEFQTDTGKVDPTTVPSLLDCLTAGVLCNGAQLNQESDRWRIVGDPTEGSLLTCAAKAGLQKTALENTHAAIEELPFDSDRKKMTIIRRSADGKTVAYVKGAPDLLLHDCAWIVENGTRRAIAQADRDRIGTVNSQLADQAMRVLAVACRELPATPEKPTPENIERDLCFLGLMAMIDPPREEAKQAVALCHRAGIRAVMITGDHKNTAVAVGRELGIVKPDSLALTGNELAHMTDAELDAKVDQIAVYARVAPEHKLRIVRAWRKRGDVVAMTGDGVNDAPAVKEADVGVSMGITGTDVTKEVSDMVVTDDNFASIVAAVEEGRGIYDNILKFIHYLLSCNAGEILVMFLSSLFGLPVPLLPIHILWVNLVTDGLPALALGVDPTDRHIMNRQPRSPSAPILSMPRLRLMVFQGTIVALVSLAAFSYAYYMEGRHSIGELLRALFAADVTALQAIFKVDPQIQEQVLGRARTICFIVLACSQDFHSYNCRSQTQSLFTLGIFSNRQLIGATLVSLTLNLLALYNPFFQKVLKTQPLTFHEVIGVVLAASVVFWVMETVKFARRRMYRGKSLAAIE
ncbi:MAG: hypothetical protein A3K19_08640 [Lentisphaerae bacterium RIFOXYB12_FULL_65_16]|nr:MAG: hypothetical protein A3K18_05625 [Lentisphaerae bacterium RIFOXYA12_64_32]OGV89483.1 MAG: hypothetical protein A3K19_08640 [Lentisphaerae bacterium RIFOXYB12_FULL_65_16]